MELQQCIVHAYSDVTNYQKAVDHLIGPNSSYSVPVLPVPSVHILVEAAVLLLSSGLASFARHRSLSLLVEHADHTDPRAFFSPRPEFTFALCEPHFQPS